MTIHKANRLLSLGRWSRLGAGILMAGLCLSARPVLAQTQTIFKFDFNEGKGTTVTDGVNKLVGTFGPPMDPANDPTIIPGPSGKAGDTAVQLPVGTQAGYLVVDDSAGTPILNFTTNAFTLETWINIDPNDLRVNEGFFSYGTATTGGGSYKFGMNNGQLRFTLYTIVDIDSGLFPALSGPGWHHVAAVWQPGVGVTFYLDGGQAVTKAETRNFIAINASILTIGAERFGNAFMGAMDRARIYNVALTPDQLDSVAATPKPLDSTCVLSFDFNETTLPFKSTTFPTRTAIFSNAYLQGAPATAPTWSSDTPSGQAGDYSLQFASGQRVVVQDPNLVCQLDPNTPAFTVQTWIKFNSVPNSTRAVYLYNRSPGGAISASVTVDRRVFVTTLAVLDITSTAFIPNDGGWHHIAVVDDPFTTSTQFPNGQLRYYVDGIAGATNAYSKPALNNSTATNIFYIGSEPATGLAAGTNPFAGLLDRLTYTKGVVTADKLDFWLIPGVPPTAPNLNIATAIQISWPTLPAGYVLQKTFDLNPPQNWFNVTNALTAANGQFTLTIPISQQAPQAYYRLFKP